MRCHGYDLRIDRVDEICLRNLQSGDTQYIFVWSDDFTTLPDDIPWKVVNWALRKNIQLELREEGARVWNGDTCECDWRPEWGSWYN